MPTPLSELQRVAQRTSRGRVHQFTRASCAQRRWSHEAAPPSPPRMPPRPYTRQVAQRALAIISRSGTNTTSIGRQHYHKWCIGACGIGGFRVAVCVWGWFSRGIGNANCGLSRMSRIVSRMSRIVAVFQLFELAEARNGQKCPFPHSNNLDQHPPNPTNNLTHAHNANILASMDTWEAN